MKQTKMESTCKVEGLYGVEIGTYAIIVENGDVLQKPLSDFYNFEPDQNDGEVVVTEDMLITASVRNGSAEFMAEYSNGASDESIPGGFGLNSESLAEEERVAEGEAMQLTVQASMSYDGKLGWEFYPKTYLMESGKIFSGEDIPEEEVESSDGEFVVPMMSYIYAKSFAEKSRIIQETKDNGEKIENYD